MRRSTPLAALVGAMNGVGSLMILVIMATILIDIGGRLLFNRPLAGTAEIVAMSIAVIVFLQFPATLQAGRVIAADGLLDIVGRRSIRWEQWLLGAYHLVGSFMFATVCWHVALLTREAFVSADFYGSLSVFTFPKWPVYAVITFGCITMAAQFLTLALAYWSAGRRNERLFEIDPANKVLS